MTIRPERPTDVAAIRAVNERAFGQPDEAALVDAVRARGERSISLVAVDGERLVGHILFTPVTIQGPDRVCEAAGLAPMAVDPGHQRRGIGSRLVARGLDRCREAGYRIAVVLGHPAYYPRFGFSPARRHGIRFERRSVGPLHRQVYRAAASPQSEPRICLTETAFRRRAGRAE